MPFQISRSYLDSHFPGRSFGRSMTVSRAGHKAGKLIPKQAATAKAIGAVTTTGTAFALGALEAKYGMPSVGGFVSADLLAGIGLHALGFFGLTGKFEPYANAAANGALAYWAGIKGSLMVQGSHHPGDNRTAGVRGEVHQGARPAMTPEQMWQMQFR